MTTSFEILQRPSHLGTQPTLVHTSSYFMLTGSKLSGQFPFFSDQDEEYRGLGRAGGDGSLPTSGPSWHDKRCNQRHTIETKMFTGPKMFLTIVLRMR